jgi:AbrB family looped-hinge helix DNA binding protein
MNITSKGQVTIPQRIRRRFGLEPGTQVEFVTEGNKVVLKPKRRRENPVELWLAERPRLRQGVTTDQLMKITRGED